MPIEGIEEKSFIKTLFGSLPQNWYIIVAACLTVIFLAVSLYFSSLIAKYFENSNGKKLKVGIYYFLDAMYTLFITFISIFPLLGMLGTVISLINLGNVFNSSNPDLDQIKSKFFLALTSTAWGIIFAVFFKIVNSFCQSYIENQIDKAKNALGL